MSSQGPRNADWFDGLDLRLPLGAPPQTRPKQRRVIAHHLILTGYGHWLPNDIRGSGSAELKQEDAGRKTVRSFRDVDPDHEVWTRAPYVVFLSTPDEVWDRIGYVEENPMKEGLPAQCWPFVQAYDGWPLKHNPGAP